jgi:hypothetical protein
LHNKTYYESKEKTKLEVMSKKCIKCNIEKPALEFRKHPSHLDGLDSSCKECASKYYQSPVMKSYLTEKKNSGRQKSILRKYRSLHRDAILARSKQQRIVNRVRNQLQLASYRIEIRQKVIDILGGSCVMCKNKSILHLCIDHMNDDGADERKIRGIHETIKKILSGQTDINSYQILCWNCNRKKQILKWRSINKNSSPDDLRTKTCTQCHNELPIGVFAKTKNRPTGIVCYCKDCSCAYILRRKQKVMNMFGGKCGCGQSDIDVLEIDHINEDGAYRRRTGEDQSIYLKLISGKRSMEGLQILCANCNAEKTYKYRKSNQISIRLPNTQENYFLASP